MEHGVKKYGPKGLVALCPSDGNGKPLPTSSIYCTGVNPSKKIKDESIKVKAFDTGHQLSQGPHTNRGSYMATWHYYARRRFGLVMVIVT